MRNRLTEIRLISIVWLLALTLVSCLPSRPTEKDMVGLWTEYRTSNDHSSPCASFEFFGDGTFEAKNIPSDRFVYEGYLPEHINVHGTWKLDTSSNDPFAVHRIVLVFDPFKGFPLGMGSVLYIPVGGAGNSLYEGVDNSVLFWKGDKCD